MAAGRYRPPLTKGEQEGERLEATSENHCYYADPEQSQPARDPSQDWSRSQDDPVGDPGADPEFKFPHGHRPGEQSQSNSSTPATGWRRIKYS